MRILLIIVICLVSLVGIVTAEGNNAEGVFSVSLDSLSEKDNSPAVVALTDIFKEIERGVVTQDAKLISKHFGKQVFLRLKSKEDTYFSANQAQYVLQNYFNTHRIISFKLSSINEELPSPYATGGGTMQIKNSRVLFQVYVALTKTNNRWFISEFNVY